MPILPLIDLLIFLGWTTFLLGGVLKAIYVTTAFRPTIASLGPMDMLLIAVVFLLLALSLAARAWVKANEPQASASRRAASTLEAYAAARANGQNGLPGGEEALPPAAQPARERQAG